MPPKGKGNSKSAAAAAVVGGGGRGSGRGGKGKGEVKTSIVTKGNGKGNVIGSKAEHPSYESNEVHTGARINTFAAGEDRAAKIRKMKHVVESHRKGDDRIVRAILAPARGVCGHRAQLRYLQVPERVVTDALFTRTDDGSDFEEGHGASQEPSLLRSLSSDEQGDDNEAILSMLTVHSLLLM